MHGSSWSLPELGFELAFFVVDIAHLKENLTRKDITKRCSLHHVLWEKLAQHRSSRMPVIWCCAFRADAEQPLGDEDDFDGDGIDLQ